MRSKVFLKKIKMPVKLGCGGRGDAGRLITNANIKLSNK